MNPDILIVVAALDEADRISATLAALADRFPRGARVGRRRRLDRRDPRARAAAAGATVVRSERVIGKGQAMTAGVRAALAQAHAEEAIVVLCDGDLGESARELSALVERSAGGADLAVAASPRASAAASVSRSPSRAGRSAVAAGCPRARPSPVSARCARGSLRDVLPFAPGFGMEIGMTIDAVRAGHRVVEVDLDLAHRATGRTPAGFVHRARQLADFIRVYLARG